MKTEKQLTTVEWFVIELRKLIKESELSDMRPSEFDTKEMMLIEQAKEMEKEKIMNAYRINPNNENWSNSGIDYYNQTFKSE
jgi:hypothetical protein